MNNTDTPNLLARGCCSLKNAGGDFQKCQLGCCNKLNAYDWLQDVPFSGQAQDIVEVCFKNTRKAFYYNVNRIQLCTGDIVAVEASPGHDIGIVSLSGELVLEQAKKNRMNLNPTEMKKIYRKAKPADIEKWKEAIDLEEPTMLKARKIAENLKLDMKIGDVEYQGDKTKAIFYYIADDRVDFRELIKVLAEEFKIRIEMRQIGARQEAGRIGGIGSCGRELCCTTWLTNFVSVTTNAARYQEVALNPQKLAGQCGKLKCCLNYELDTYLDGRKDFPDTSIPLQTEQGLARHQKTDVFRRLMWYSMSEEETINLIPISVERVSEIIALNQKGIIIKSLDNGENTTPASSSKEPKFHDVASAESLTRFDDHHKAKKKHRKPKHYNQNAKENPNQPA